MAHLTTLDEDIDLARDEPPTAGPVLRAVARIPDHLVLGYLLGLAVISGGAILGMVVS